MLNGPLINGSFIFINISEVVDGLRQCGLFFDLNTQSKAIGEFQHALESATLISTGDVLLANTQGRQSQQQITIYDNSALSIQDLYITQKILEIS